MTIKVNRLALLNLLDYAEHVRRQTDTVKTFYAYVECNGETLYLKQTGDELELSETEFPLRRQRVDNPH
jgi:hypothetical protein